MLMRVLGVAAFVALLMTAPLSEVPVGAAQAPVQRQAGMACVMLSAPALPNTTITTAETIPAGQFRRPVAGRGVAAPGIEPEFSTLPAFCRVAATLRPSADSDIKIEVWMPASGWN